MQKEQFTLWDDKGEPSMFLPIMLATLRTCAQIEIDDIKFRLDSGCFQYRKNCGKVGVMVRSVTSHG